MEIKKSPKANLEKDKSTGFLIGIVFGLAVLFVGFEWGEKDVEISVNTGFSAVIEEEEIESTEQEEEIPPPPEPEPEPEKAPEVINEVENTVEVEHVEIASTEDDFNKAQVDTYVAPSAVEEVEEEYDDDYIHQNVEIRPEFPGGETALWKWINDNMNYPTIASDNGIKGTVLCSFVVNVDGSVQDVVVTRSANVHLDREAVRVLKLLPKFKPGEQSGKKVRVRYNVPVRFVLR